MNIEHTIRWLRSIDIQAEVLRSRRSNEENIKARIIIPLLEMLGWRIGPDMDFEVQGADIVLHDGSQSPPKFVVETKSWDEVLTDSNVMGQCLEYMRKLQTPWLLLTSGQLFHFHSALVQPESLVSIAPLEEICLDDLIGHNAENALRRLEQLIGKPAVIAGADGMTAIVAERISPQSVVSASQVFVSTFHRAKKPANRNNMTESRFRELAEAKAPRVREALLLLLDFVLSFRGKAPVRTRYCTKEIGIEAFIEKGLARKQKVGLFGVYPEKGQVAFGHDSFEWLRLPTHLARQMKTAPNPPLDAAAAQKLITLVQTSLVAVGLHK